MNIQGTIKRKSIYFLLPLIAFYKKVIKWKFTVQWEFDTKLNAQHYQSHKNKNNMNATLWQFDCTDSVCK